MLSIFDLSWKQDGFWDKFHLVCLSESKMSRFYRTGTIFGKKVVDNKYRKLQEVSCLSDLSSTYHSVSMTAGAKIKKIFSHLEKKFKISYVLEPPSAFFWFFLGSYCYFRAMLISNKVLKVAGGYENIDANQCDVRQSILRRRILFRKKWLCEALFCIDSGLKKESQKHTRALLLVGKADILEKLGTVGSFFLHEREIIEMLDDAELIALEIQDENPFQAIRIFRHCADILDRIGEEGSCIREKAKILAKSWSLDQLAKI